MPEYTICIVRQGDRVLLGMKKRGWCQGFWNGFGGKIHEGESPAEAAVRELAEEAGIRARSCTTKGIITFTFRDDPKVVRTHIFEIPSFDGEPQESEEMLPQWFPISGIPYDAMLKADTYWLPIFLDGGVLEARFLYDNPKEFNLLQHEVLSSRV